MKDEDFIIDQMKTQADALEESGDLENARMIRDLLPSDSKKDNVKVGINIETTVDKFDENMNLIETVRI